MDFQEAGKVIVDSIEDIGKKSFERLGDLSKPLLEMGKKTANTTKESLERYLRGEVDAEAVRFTTEQAGNQLVDLARAEGNLAALIASEGLKTFLLGIVNIGLALLPVK